MSTETIDHTTLRKLAEAGVVSTAHVIGQAGGWEILVKYGVTERALAATRSHQVRIFRKFETLVDYLKGVGIFHFEVNSANYATRSLVDRSRPDQSAKMKSAHQAAAYDEFFRQHVQGAIDDTRPRLTTAQARTQIDAARTALMKAKS